MSFETLFKLLKYAKSHRSRVYRATCFSVINKLFDIAPEILIGVAIDVVVNRESSFIGRYFEVDLTGQLMVLGVLTFVIWACESLFEYLYKLDWRFLAQSIQHELRCATYDHVQNLDMAKFENASVGHWVSILNDDINQLERFLDSGANSLIQVITTVVAIGAVFFFLSPLIALFAFLPVPFILIGAFYFQKKAAPLYSSVREFAGRLGARLTGNLSGISTIKSFVAEERELSFLEQESEQYVQANERAIRISSAFIPVIRMAILTGFMATLVLGGWLALNGRLDVGSYGVLVFLTQRLLWPLTGLAETADLFERAMASTRRVFGLLEEPIEIQSGRHLSQSEMEGEIEFENVSFGYNSVTPVLQHVSFRVPGGKTVAFVGSTGSGKSTVVKLLLRFYEAQEGGIRIDQRDLKEYSLDYLRGQIGLVSQEVFLFQGSVLENIRYGRPGASEQEVVAAAQAAEADGFIRELPNGYNTQVGERGQKLSGGQRQRISLARAILKDPAILVLDEATSAVDNETEAAIQRSMDVVSKGRTTLVVAHRLSTVVNSDQIFVVEGGRIVDSGRHADLVQKPGVYRSLWMVQTGEAKGELTQR